MTLQHVLLKIARAAIEEQFGKPFNLSREILEAQFPQLMEPTATFVTIYIDDDTVRGCIGSIMPHQSLYDDIVYNAKAAAFEDPRFYALTQDEYQYCAIEISLLNVPKKLNYADEEELREMIRPHIDGVLLQQNDKSATFLPQVWSEFPKFSQFFSQLGVKAGLRDYALDSHPTVYTFQVEKFADEPMGEEALTQEEESITLYETAQACEAAFYKAFEEGDIHAMLTLWSDNENSMCIHPAGKRLQGREAIDESWRDMFESEPNIHFELQEVKYTESETISVHLMREIVMVKEEIVGVMITTNVYTFEDDSWRLHIHHATPDPSAYSRP